MSTHYTGTPSVIPSSLPGFSTNWEITERKKVSGKQYDPYWWQKWLWNAASEWEPRGHRHSKPPELAAVSFRAECGTGWGRPAKGELGADVLKDSESLGEGARRSVEICREWKGSPLGCSGQNTRFKARGNFSSSVYCWGSLGSISLGICFLILKS